MSHISEYQEELTQLLYNMAKQGLYWKLTCIMAYLNMENSDTFDPVRSV